MDRENRGIVRDSLEVYRGAFTGFLTVGLVASLGPVLIWLVARSGIRPLLEDEGSLFASYVYPLIEGPIVSALTGAFVAVAAAVVFCYVERLWRQEGASLGRAFVAVLPRLLPLFALGSLTGVIYGIFDYLRDIVPSGAEMFLLVGGISLFVYLGPALLQAPFISFSIGAGPVASIRAGLQMVAGHRGMIIGQSVGLSVPSFVIISAITLILSWFGPLPFVLNTIVLTLGASVGFPVLPIGMASMHLDLRQRELEQARGSDSVAARPRLTEQTMQSLKTRSAARILSWLIAISVLLIGTGFWIADRVGVADPDLDLVRVLTSLSLVLVICLVVVVLSRRALDDRAILERQERLNELQEERKRRFLRRAAGRVAEDHAIGEDVRLTGSVFTLTEGRRRAAKISDGRRRWVVTWRDGRWEYL
ncbi:MAG: hypothetical protein ACLFP4_13630 [Spirochaetales bacterium]